MPSSTMALMAASNGRSRKLYDAQPTCRPLILELIRSAAPAADRDILAMAIFPNSLLEYMLNRLFSGFGISDPIIYQIAALGLLLCSFVAIAGPALNDRDRKSTRLNSSHLGISYAV